MLSQSEIKKIVIKASKPKPKVRPRTTLSPADPYIKLWLAIAILACCFDAATSSWNKRLVVRLQAAGQVSSPTSFDFVTIKLSRRDLEAMFTKAETEFKEQLKKSDIFDSPNAHNYREAMWVLKQEKEAILEEFDHVTEHYREKKGLPEGVFQRRERYVEYLLGLVGLGVGIKNAYDIGNLRTNVKKLTAQFKSLAINQVEINKELAKMNENDLIWRNDELLHERFAAYKDDVEALKHALQAIKQQTLPTDLLDTAELNKIIKEHFDDNAKNALPISVAYTMKVTTYVHADEVTFVIAIPQSPALFSLDRIEEAKFFTKEREQLSVFKIQSPDYIASDTSRNYIYGLSAADLLTCEKTHKLYLCNKEILYHSTSQRCIAALYTRDMTDIVKFCKLEKVDFGIVQTGTNEYSFSDSHKVHETCHLKDFNNKKKVENTFQNTTEKATESEDYLYGITVLKTRPGCQYVIGNEFKIMAKTPDSYSNEKAHWVLNGRLTDKAAEEAFEELLQGNQILEKAKKDIKKNEDLANQIGLNQSWSWNFIDLLLGLFIVVTFVVAIGVTAFICYKRRQVNRTIMERARALLGQENPDHANQDHVNQDHVVQDHEDQERADRAHEQTIQVGNALQDRGQDLADLMASNPNATFVLRSPLDRVLPEVSIHPPSRASALPDTMVMSQLQRRHEETRGLLPDRISRDPSRQPSQTASRAPSRDPSRVQSRAATPITDQPPSYAAIGALGPINPDARAYPRTSTPTQGFQDFPPSYGDAIEDELLEIRNQANRIQTLANATLPLRRPREVIPPGDGNATLPAALTRTTRI